MPRTDTALLAPIAEPAAHVPAGIVTPAQTAPEVPSPQQTAEPAAHGGLEHAAMEHGESKERGAKNAMRSKAGTRKVRCCVMPTEAAHLGRAGRVHLQ